jgi:hypothetical protein
VVCAADKDADGSVTDNDMAGLEEDAGAVELIDRGVPFAVLLAEIELMASEEGVEEDGLRGECAAIDDA